ncbi:uncharacterized protein LOC119089710 [Pollicipes pollicipes]|nr:uncharacterized protein LOC119089710 [Pollicipes pollicipes]
MFGCFGVITKIRIKERDPAIDLYREQRDGCYAFITYVSHSAAVAAQANGSARYPQLEVKFGGRREFCLDQYADQDADLNNPAYYGMKGGGDSALDFDTLLQMEMQRVKKTGHPHNTVA